MTCSPERTRTSPTEQARGGAIATCQAHRGRLERITRTHFEAFWFRGDMPLAKIGAALGVTGSAISWRAKALGLPNRGKLCQRRGTDAEFRRLWNTGVPVKEIADRLGYTSVHSISHRRKSLGLPPRPRNMRARWIADREARLADEMRRAA